MFCFVQSKPPPKKQPDETPPDKESPLVWIVVCVFWLIYVALIAYVIWVSW